MIQFRTKIPLKKQQYNQLDFNANLLLLGSCFVENIGTKLNYYKFLNAINPFGILFHTKAIENLLLNAINKKVFTEKDIFFHNEHWHSFEAHSKLSNPSKEVLLNHLNDAIKLTNQQINKSTHIIITLGTAWCYRYIETDTIVANCHKIPQKKFLKELLTIEEITESLEASISLLRSVNKNVTILFTVSPVRHLKDGFIENQQSKAHLISAIHNVIDNQKQTYYFPAYEIMMDELRDYRFYKEDMLHPNQTAINYIWERFTDVWISESAQKTMLEVENIQKGLAHKPFNKNTDAHKAFLKQLKEKQEKLSLRFPTITF